MSWFFERWLCPLQNEKLWWNFSNHRHHQGQGGAPSPFTHSPNVGHPTAASDKVFAAATDPHQPSEGVANHPIMFPSLFWGVWEGEVRHGHHIVHPGLLHSLRHLLHCGRLFIHSSTIFNTAHTGSMFSREKEGRAMRRPLFLREHSTKAKKSPHTQQGTSIGDRNHMGIITRRRSIKNYQ